MPIAFTCPHCGVRTDVAEEYAGQTGPCAACGQTITVPPLAGTPGYAAPVPTSPAILIVALILVVAVAAVLVCGGVLFFVAVGRSVAVAPATVATSASAPATVATSDQDRFGSCVGNLRRIGVALHSYHDAYGTFPPAYLADKDGKPMHSWRVLLLPYLDRQFLYDQYRFDQPWDSPQNTTVAGSIDDMFRCRDDRQSGPATTGYLMIVGPGAISDGPTAHSLGDIKDGTSNTIVVVEVANSGIQWTEPRDLDAKDLAFQASGSGAGIQSNHAGEVHVLLADGCVRTLDASISPEVLRAMATIAGGEVVESP